MAIVANLANIGTPVDQRLCTPNRQNAGTPIGALTPLFSGELVFDTTNARLFQAIGTANTDWLHVSARSKT